jgi:hypothetical protein
MLLSPLSLYVEIMRWDIPTLMLSGYGFHSIRTAIGGVPLPFRALLPKGRFARVTLLIASL